MLLPYLPISIFIQNSNYYKMYARTWLKKSLRFKVLYHEDGSIKGIATNDVGIHKDGSPKVLNYFDLSFVIFYCTRLDLSIVILCFHKAV